MAIEEGAITGSPADVKVKPAGPLEARGRELGRKGDQMSARVASGWRDRAKDVDAAKHRVADRIHDGRERITHEVEAHPVRTLLWAAGAGAVVGFMLERRSRNHQNPR